MREGKLNDRPYCHYCFGEAGKDQKCEPAKCRKRYSAEKGCLSGRQLWEERQNKNKIGEKDRDVADRINFTFLHEEGIRQRQAEGIAAAEACGMPVGTFYGKARKFENTT